jgi:low temperature requirement protein LtrA
LVKRMLSVVILSDSFQQEFIQPHLCFVIGVGFGRLQSTESDSLTFFLR